MGSGGANGGPQYNPANVSATGGNGQSASNTQAAKYIPGMKSLGSTGTETMAQQGGAAMYAEPSLPAVTPITAPTSDPNQHVLDGAPIGPGANSVAGLPMQATNDPDVQLMRDHYDILSFWASQPGASQSTKDYVAYVGTIIS